ncbi:MAG: DOMON-like domain-containing protein [Gammaproteobacteria bacterium]
MYRHRLHAHTAAPPAADFELEAGTRGIPGGCGLDFRLQGDMARLRLGSGRGRSHGLWRQTCFEAFLAAADAPGYLEFNFAPSGAWAAWRFDARRQGMQPLELPRPPDIRSNRSERSLELTVQFPLPFASPSWRLGLAAVLEDNVGRMSYWALAHPGPQPDFHDPAGFLLEFTAT